jgi:hypothetical protein
MQKLPQALLAPGFAPLLLLHTRPCLNPEPGCSQQLVEVLRAVPQPPAAQSVPRSALALTYSYCSDWCRLALACCCNGRAVFGIRRGNVTDVWRP